MSRKKPGTASRTREHHLPGGIETEHRLTYLQQRIGMHLRQSTELDEVYKIDALIEKIRPLQGSYEPIAQQITQRRKAWEKIRTFVAQASKMTKGPLLYVEVAGKVTLEMAAATRAAAVSLWLETPRRDRRAHGLIVTPSGTYHWFNIPQP